MSAKILYVSPEEADSYVSGREEAVFWNALSASEKINAIGRAGDVLDSCMIWNGAPVSAGQTLRWPRKGVSDADGIPVSESEIPQAVKNAVCEQAFYISDPELKKLRRMNRSGIKNASLGGLSVSVNGNFAEQAISRAALNCVLMFGHLRSDCSDNCIRTSCGTLNRG